MSTPSVMGVPASSNKPVQKLVDVLGISQGTDQRFLAPRDGAWAPGGSTYMDDGPRVEFESWLSEQIDHWGPLPLMEAVNGGAIALESPVPPVPIIAEWGLRWREQVEALVVFVYHQKQVVKAGQLHGRMDFDRAEKAALALFRGLTRTAWEGVRLEGDTLSGALEGVWRSSETKRVKEEARAALSSLREDRTVPLATHQRRFSKVVESAGRITREMPVEAYIRSIEDGDERKDMTRWVAGWRARLRLPSLEHVFAEHRLIAASSRAAEDVLATARRVEARRLENRDTSKPRMQGNAPCPACMKAGKGELFHLPSACWVLNPRGGKKAVAQCKVCSSERGRDVFHTGACWPKCEPCSTARGRPVRHEDGRCQKF
jgi:hypothetical protein